jgi:hypothetical protein
MADLAESFLDQVRAASDEPDERDLNQEPGEGTYWRTCRLSDLFGNHIIESLTACELWRVMCVLTDLWALHPQHRREAAALMHEATDELLALSRVEELDGYAARWNDRLDAVIPRLIA